MNLKWTNEKRQVLHKMYILDSWKITYKINLNIYAFHSVTKTSRDLNPFVGRPGMMILQNWIPRPPCY